MPQEKTLPTPTPILLESLPPELLIYILTFLAYPALTNLQNTSHRFQTLSPPNLLSSARTAYRSSLFAREKETAKFMLEHPDVETGPTGWQRSRFNRNCPTILVCYSCFSELPRESFGHSQIARKRGYGQSAGCRRFCVSCGVRDGVYIQDTAFKDSDGGMSTVSGTNIVKICIVCGPLVPLDTFVGQKGLCKRCFYIREYGKEPEIEGQTNEMKAADAGTWPDLWRQSFGGRTRAENCQRCWALDHSNRAAVASGLNHELLCEQCLARIL